jgi:hypothetical protein
LQIFCAFDFLAILHIHVAHNQVFALHDKPVSEDSLVVQIVENWHNLLGKIWLALSVNVMLEVILTPVLECASTLQTCSSIVVVAHLEHHVDHIFTGL